MRPAVHVIALAALVSVVLAQQDLTLSIDSESQQDQRLDGQQQSLAAAPPVSKTSPIKAPSQTASRPGLAGLVFKGGCTDRPATPANSNVKCSTNSGCEVTCLEDYALPDRSTRLSIRCEDATWRISNNWDRMPDCEPICSPPCQNLGFCLAPNICKCADGFEGPQCQTAKTKPCLDKPPTPMNSRVVCNEKECTATCNKGFAFPGNTKKLTLACLSGVWTQQNASQLPESQQQSLGSFKKVPDCQQMSIDRGKAVCDPLCQNGGRCLPNNICECPPNFRGTHCSYSVENCSPEKLNFNGGYNCSGRGAISFSCSLNCGGEGEFEFTPEPVYTCLYAEAVFKPSHVPQCIFESDQVQYVSTNSSTRTEMVVETPGSHLEWARQQKAKGLLVEQEQEQEWTWISGGQPRLIKTGELSENQHTYQKYFENFFSGNEGDYSIAIPEYSLVRETSAKPGTCLAWGKLHVKTFDGKVYSFESDCSYVLLRDIVSSTFSVVLGHQKKCVGNKKNKVSLPCKRSITVYIEDFIYEIDTTDNGEPIIRKGDQSVVIPSAIDGLLTERISNFVVLRAEGLGFTVKWDTKSTVMLDVSEALWNRTGGLCGRVNGFWMDDFENRDGSHSSSLLGFVNSWEAEDSLDGCGSSPSEKHACSGETSEEQEISNAAAAMCQRLLEDPKFEACHKVLDPKPYYETCRWDYCKCGRKGGGEKCACTALETYFRECLRQGGRLPQEGWRDPTLCPMSCEQGKVYMMCGPVADETCSSTTDGQSIQTADFCVEGCFCPKDSALHEGRCVPRSTCPCTYGGKVYQSGQQIPNDCNTCTCVAGQWQCTELRCGVRCAVVGDPHYTTFDGRHYDFMGKCSYYLMKDLNYTIEAENVPCAGAISEAMNFPAKVLPGVPSCTKSVTVRWRTGSNSYDVIKLRPNRDVLINGDPPAVLPLWIDGLVIRHASSVFLSVELPNGLEIWWDGFSRVYIDAPATFYGNTQGLCGTFNENQRDDLKTPEGDVEESVEAFANGWKTSETCRDVDGKTSSPPHPCDVNPHHKAKAQKACSVIRESLFESCHHLVDPEQFYLDCLYDVCACEGVKLSKCICPAISSYAKECSQKGAVVDWVADVRECGVHCEGGQTFQVCGNSCGRTCYDIALYPKCRKKCVEGCNCPEGQALSPLNGQCIPIGKCPCLHKGVEYPPGHRELRPGVRSPDVCTCISARWSCRPATEQEQRDMANQTSTSPLQCRSSANEEFTDCEPEVQLTCKTMHDQVSLKKPSVCRPGCRCKKGYVWDVATKKCIKPTDCPCHHGGQSYGEGERISQDCNSCTCKSGRWNCTTNQCPGICTNWGESHFKTFDGKTFDFHGNCDYMFAKGAGTEPNEKFHVTIQSVPCGSSGVACAKAITLRLGPPDSEETITLIRHKAIPFGKFTQRIMVREAGLFIFVEVADLGLVLQWDHGTRVYLRLDPKWKGRVRGLCGNFNDNALDDFQGPSGGLVEADVKTFGDSWRLQKYCPETVDYIDTCTLHPQRKVWSVMKCSLLKSKELFGRCHPHVPVDYFFDRCVLDSCGCDMGGDCECLCTSFAAYAHECNLHGVPIKWRSQELCPLQCDEECSTYTPCMSTCPAVSCDNPFGATALCSEDACVEGCLPQACPRGQVHRSVKYQPGMPSCISLTECRSAVCLEVDGVLYAEGDVMEKDACHACYCSKGKRVCQGQPCLPPTTTTVATTTKRPSTTTLPPSPAAIASCRTGWSEWFNTHHPKAGGDPTDREPIPDQLQPGLVNSPMCGKKQMVDIECRTADGSRVPHKKTGDNVDCGLPAGLECIPGGIKGRSVCHDYEVRVLCDCSSLQDPKTTVATVRPVMDRCDPFQPHVQHPTSCHLFYHCVDRPSGVEMVEKTCNPPTMFNPFTMICDWPESVIRVRPECAFGPTTTTTRSPPTRKATDAGLVAKTTLATPKRCDPARPHVQHPTSCHLFYHCVDRSNGAEMVEKTCNPPTMFHPVTMVCEWPESVIKVRPECGSSPTAPPTKTTIQPTKTGTCPSGYEWKACAFRCDQLCLAFQVVLQEHGHCASSLTGCAPGCLPAKPEGTKTCPAGTYWRDAHTCVPIQDCNCITPAGDIVAPGTVVEDEEEPCQVCQCLDNEYVCDRSACSAGVTYKWVTDSVELARNVSFRRRTTVRPRPPGPSPTPISCSGWSQWINDQQPTSTGEKEFRSLEQLQRQSGFCVHGRLIDIECRDVQSGQLAGLGRDRDVVCSLSDGLVCLTSKQGKGGRCQDYKIRYFCECTDKESLISVTTARPTTTTTVMIWTTPTTKPPIGHCPTEHQFGVLNDPDRPIPDSAFTATSSANAKLGPHNARHSGQPTSWVADKMELDQHIQVDLGRPTRIDGFLITGNPSGNQFVTSLFVLYSLDNQRFSYVLDKAGKPILFRGPLEHSGIQRNSFDSPVEGRYVRLEPQTWKHGIALQFDLLSCSQLSVRTTTAMPMPAVRCTDEMGMENGLITDEQITLSDFGVGRGVKEVRLNRGGVSTGWKPSRSSRQEWVKIDLLEPRNLTGIIVQGGGGEEWVESFILRYSTDGEWITMLNDQGAQRIFPANVDGQSLHTTMFERPIRARYVQLVPWTWHGSVVLRLELVGCYQPVAVKPTTIVTTTPRPTTTSTTTTTTKTPYLCNPCPNLPPELLNLDNCLCPPGQHRWNGTGCVASPAQCPCVDGNVRYPVGAIYQRHDDCSHCVCQLGGTSQCRPPVCPPCSSPGLRSVLSPSPQCQCSCRPCPERSRLCPSTNHCLNETLWCNGVEDCPDDELNCVTTTPQPAECPFVVCADGYREELVDGLVSSNNCPVYQCVASERFVPESDTCPTPECPPGYTLELHHDYDYYDVQQQGQQHSSRLESIARQSQQLNDLQQISQQTDNGQQQSQGGQQTTQCPPYKCIPPPEPVTTTKPPPVIEGRQDRCDLTSRIFRTFDGGEFSYDICHHILVRDRIDDLWAVTIHKNCSNLDQCTRALRIRHGKKDVISLLPNFRIGFNNFEYAFYQAKEIAVNSDEQFSLQRVGDTVIFRSMRFGFWVVWDTNMNVKIGVTWKLLNKIDGLCGLYNMDVSDDHLSTPTGKPVSTAAEFGEAWRAEPHLGPEDCGPPSHCLIATQTAAWEECGSVLRQEPFNQCYKPDELDQAVFQCVDAMCDCVTSTVAFSVSDAIEKCACQVMSMMATECHNAHPATHIDLSGWRNKHDCPLSCPPSSGMIYRECNDRRHCESTCSDRRTNPRSTCPEDLPELCYPGCVCPEGLVRRESDDVCVKPVDCRDCVCQGFGDPHYVTFDRANYTFNGNCTYVAARDQLSDGDQLRTDHDFQVLVTNQECQLDTKTTCTAAVTVLYQDHVIEMRRLEPTNSALTSLDGQVLDNFPVYLPWMRMERVPGTGEVSILLLAIQVEVTYYVSNAAFKVRLPSQTYLNRTEGLCGNCNGELDDDLPSNGHVHGVSWLVKDNQLSAMNTNHIVGKDLQRLCGVMDRPECSPLDPSVDPCLMLVDSDIFRECNAVVDPLPYLSACQYDVCKAADPIATACGAMEAYARDCGQLGICLAWRSEKLCPVECPAGSGMEYRQCGSGCLDDCSLHQDNGQQSAVESCPMSPEDGCYCPDGQAFHQSFGRCVPVDHCEHCDADGHLRGESWDVDECANCTCLSESGKLICDKKECVLDQCVSGWIRKVIDPKPGECCPTVICLEAESLVVTNKTCPTIPAPICGKNQVLRYQPPDSNGCLRQVCECIPANQCQQIVLPVAQPGEKYSINNRTGCCPRLERLCVTEECPPPPDCPPFYETEVVPPAIPTSPDDSIPCCPEYRCTLPTDVCIYEHKEPEMEEMRVSPTSPTTTTAPSTTPPQTSATTKKAGSTGSKQSVKGRKRRDVQLLASLSALRRYEINETWSDGPCVQCVCEYDPLTKSARSVCTTQTCPSTYDEGYILTSSPPAVGECCPRIMRSACQLETRVYKAGETWPAPGGDPCKSYRCVQLDDGSVLKQLEVAECKTQCPAGWRYRPANSSVEDGQEAKCCGECIQIACTARDGKEHKLGRMWKPDPCTTAVCVERANRLLQVETTKETCTEPSAEERLLFAFEVQPPTVDECCPIHRKTACMVNDVQHKVNATWMAEDDPCVTYACIDENGEGQLVHQKTIQSCRTECSEGFEYQPAALGSKECCGRCVQTACLLDGNSHPVGSTWQPDPCTFLTCTEDGQLIRAEVMCSPAPPDCPPENFFAKPGECCATCNATQSLSNEDICTPEVLPLSDTVGLVRSGGCTNIEPIEGLTECKGLCQSGTYHDPDSPDPLSRCNCCSPIETKELAVELVCRGGVKTEKVERKIRVPTRCSCTPCFGEEDSQTAQLFQQNRGTGK